jgi:hypothetical protein
MRADCDLCGRSVALARVLANAPLVLPADGIAVVMVATRGDPGVAGVARKRAANSYWGVPAPLMAFIT